MFGQVKVEGNRYRPSGSFHQISPNSPIRDVDDNLRLLGVTKPRSMTYIHSYGGEAIFFESLSKKKLLASRCNSSVCGSRGTVYMPFRTHCPDCLEKNSIVDITDTAKKSAAIYTFMVCERSGAFNMLGKPIKFINIAFDGVSTILMSYLLVGEPSIGQRVLPVFRTTDPTYTILDLAWVIENSHENEIPDGFSF